MSNCTLCHQPMKSGVVVHSECLEQWMSVARWPEDSRYGERWIAYRYKPREWVSVKERRPEYDSPVWGWDTQDHCAKEVNYIDGEFFDMLGEDANITHWMPLPEPPEVE